MVGLSHGYDQVATRGDIAGRSFTAFYYRDQRLIAADSLNRPSEHMLSRKLLDRGISPTPEQVADPSCNLQALLAVGNPG
jgi:3-phenylpropionate/trans-cinnamate dioxygenase ferredoxin reductase subunit